MSEVQQTTDLTVPTEMKKVSFTAEHAREVGLPSPEAVNYMMSVANMLIDSALVTPDMAPDDAAVAAWRQAGWTEDQISKQIVKAIKSNAMAKMLVGREMDMQAMESLQDVDIVKGRIFIRYPQLYGQVIKKGFKIKQLERSHTRAAVEVSRDGEEPEVFEFTIEDAKRAKLLKKEADAWKDQYILRPRVMLWSRLMSEVYRAKGGRSNVYTPEEKEEVLGHREDPDAADKQRMAVIEQKYSVGVKTEPEPPVVVDISTKAAPAAEAPAVVTYEAWQYNEQGTPIPNTHGSIPQPNPVAGVAFAQNLADKIGAEIVVMKCEGGRATEFDRCKPREKAAPRKAESKPETVKETYKDTLKRLQDVLAKAGDVPVETAAARMKTFLVGFLGVAGPRGLTAELLGSDRGAVAIGALSDAISADFNTILSEPLEAGRRFAPRTAEDEAPKPTDPFASEEWQKAFTALKWPADIIDLAKEVCRQMKFTPDRFVQWVEAVALDFMPVSETKAYLQLGTLNMDAAGKLKVAAKKHNFLMAKAVEQFIARAGLWKDTPPEKVMAMVDAWILEVQATLRESSKPKAEESASDDPPDQEGFWS